MIVYKTTNAMYGVYSVYYVFLDTTDNKTYWIWYDSTTQLYYMSQSVGVPMARYDVATGNTKIGSTCSPLSYIYNGLPVWWDGGIQAYINWGGGGRWWATPSIGYYAPVIGGVPPSRNWWANNGGATAFTLFLGSAGDQSLNFKWKAVTLPVSGQLPVRLDIPGRFCSTINGVYVPTGSSGSPTGNRYLGWRKFPITDSTYSGNLCETDVEYNSKSVFKFFLVNDPNGVRYCWYDNTQWVISATVGIKTATIGYWLKTTTGGNPDGTYNRTFSQPTPPITVPTPASYTVTNTITYTELLPYTGLRSVLSMNVAEVALWL